MKRRRLIQGVCVLAMVPVAGWPGPIEQVSLSLGTPHSTIQSAIDAVDDGGTVEIIESGEYVGPVRIPGGKTFAVVATVGDVVSTNAGESWIVPGPTSAGYVPGVVDVTLTGFTIRRTAGSGAALEVEVREHPNHVYLTANSMKVEHTEIDGGGEAVLAIDRANPAQDGLISFSSNDDSEFRTAQTTGTAKSAFRVHGDASSNVSSFFPTFTATKFTNNADAPVIRFASPIHQAILQRIDVAGPGTGIEVESVGPFAFLNFWVVGGRIVSGRRCFTTQGTATGTVWLSDCTLDNSASTSGEPTVVVDLVTYSIPIPWGPSFEPPALAALHRNRIDCGNVSGGSPCVAMNGKPSAVAHNTFVAAGTATSPALAVGPSGFASSVTDNLFLNFGAPDFLTGGNNWAHNVVVGPVDDPTRGTNSAYAFAAPGVASAIAVAALDPVDLMPLAGSPALGAGAFSPYTNFPYVGFPLGTNPDVGWLENTALPLPHGDVNNDGALDLADVTELGNYLAGHVAMPAGDLDVDNNGVVNSLDVDYLAQFFVGNGPNPQP